MPEIIFFEGLPGSGKSTQLDLLRLALPGSTIVFPRLDVTRILFRYLMLDPKFFIDIPEDVMIHLEKVCLSLLQSLNTNLDWVLIERSFVTTIAWNYVKKNTGFNSHLYEIACELEKLFTQTLACRFVYLKLDHVLAIERDVVKPVHSFITHNFSAFAEFYDNWFSNRKDTIWIEVFGKDIPTISFEIQHQLLNLSRNET